MVSSAISKNDRLPMGDSASQPNAQSLRNLLVGLSRFEQFPVAIQWARENHCVVYIKRSAAYFCIKNNRVLKGTIVSM